MRDFHCYPHQGDPKPDLIALAAPVPPDLARVFGYRGTAQFVGFRWEPGGEDIKFDDGKHSGRGDMDSWLAYLQHPAVYPHLDGYRDLETAHALVIDRVHHLAGVIPIACVRMFLKQQYPPDSQMKPEQLAQSRHSIERTLVKGCQEQPVEGAVRRHIRERRIALAKMMSYLDRWPHVE